MQIGPNDFSHKNNHTRTYTNEDAALPPVQVVHAAKTLDTLFDKNQLIAKPQKAAQDKQAFGLFKYLKSFFQSDKQQKSAVETPKVEASGRVQFKPQLSEPDNLPVNLKKFSLTKMIDPASQLDDADIFAKLADLDKHSMYEIMRIVAVAQKELAKEGVLLNMDEYEQFQKMQVYQKKIMQKLQEKLSKDEWFRKLFDTIQKVSVAVGVIATLSSFLIVTIPFASVAAGISAVISTGSKSHYSMRSDQDTAEIIGLDHKMKNAKRQMNEASERMGQLAEDSQMEKALGKMLQDLIKMINQILHK